MPLSILQITDLHLRKSRSSRLLGVNTADTLTAVLDTALAERRPTALLVTGDIAHDPTEQAYRHFTDIVRERYDGPVLCIPGNHDLEAPVAQLARKQYPDSWQLALGQWRIIGFDSHLDGQIPSHFPNQRLQQLRALCEQAPEPYVLLATHHHLLPIASPWLDKDRIQKAEELLEWCVEHNRTRPRARIRGLVFGHIHQPYTQRHDDIMLLGCPSTCFQFAPRSQTFAVDTKLPGYRWLQLGPRGGLTTRVKRVNDYPLSIEMPS